METTMMAKNAGALPDSWYAFHFGSKFANSTKFDPETLYGAINRECYIMLADFCSFTSFFQATEDLKLRTAWSTSSSPHARVRPSPSSLRGSFCR